MSAYAGYTNAGFSDDSGGFFAGGSQQGSQGGGGAKNYQEMTLRPVTAKQVLDAEEPFSGADFNIDGTKVSQITLVGQVRTFTAQPTNILIRIDDGTGQIEVRKFIDNDKQEEAANPGYNVDSHVRVWGHIRSFSDKKYVNANLVQPVTDFNEVNYHMLESTYVHLYLTRGGPPGQNGATADGDSMFIDGGTGHGQSTTRTADTSGKLSGCSAVARKMYSFMEQTPGGNEGIHLHVITKETNMSVRDVLAAADELLGQGLVYTTVDDETWAILEY